MLKTDEILRVEGLGKRFGGFEVLKDVNFNIRQGERRAFIGPNGAGKTTLFNMIAGDLEASCGKITYLTKEITYIPNYKRAGMGMTRTFQKNNLMNELTVLENLLLVLQRNAGAEKVWFKPRTRRTFPDIYKKAEAILETWQLTDKAQVRVSHLSYGEQRQVEIILGIAMEPLILLLDEPTAGMSHSETQHILGLLQNIPKDLTLLIIEHDMDVVFGVAEQITVLHNGGVFLEGDPQTVQHDQRVHEIYFGKAGVLYAAN